MSLQKAKITDFFALKKRPFESQPPAKRRKILGSEIKKKCPIIESPKKVETNVPPSKTTTVVLSPVKASVSTPRKDGTPVKCPLTPDEVKRRLGRVRKLSDLQSRIKELSSPEKKGNPKKDLSFSYDVPSIVHSPKKPLPPASPSKKPLPSYIKHLDLSSGLLPLPKSYRKLAAVFSAMDQIMSLRCNRGESIRLNELFTPVQNVTRSELTLEHIEKICCILPKAYKFSWEKKKGRFGHMIEDYEMIIAPSNEDGEVEKNLTPLNLVERKKQFNDALFGITKDCHTKFLRSLDPPITIDDTKLARWHKDFNPDLICPEIDRLALPEKPFVNKLLNVTDAMKEAERLFHPEKLSKPEGSPADNNKEKEEEKAYDLELNLQERFKGINPALVKKILAKEKAKVEKELVEGKGEIDKKKRLDQLFDIARVLRNTFIGEKKVALRMDFLLPKLTQAFCLGNDQLKSMIKSLSEIAPSYVKLIFIRQNEYVKLDKNISLIAVETAITKHKEKNTPL